MRDRYGQEMHAPGRTYDPKSRGRSPYPHAHPAPQEDEIAISFCGGQAMGKTLTSKLLMQRLRDEGFTVRRDVGPGISDTDRDTIYVRIDDEQRKAIAAEIRE